LVETSNQHYKVLITPDQSVTTVLSTSAGFYNSLLSHKKGWNFYYLKLLSPIDLRSSYLFVGWLFGSNVSNERKMLFGSNVSNKRYVGCCLDLCVSNKLSLYRYKYRKMFSMRYKDDYRKRCWRDLIAFALREIIALYFKLLPYSFNDHYYKNGLI